MSTIKSSDEHLTLNADGSSKDIKFQANGVEKASISSAGVISSDGGSTHADNVKAKFGTGNDLEIYHDGTDSYIHDSGSGNLELRTNGVQIGIMAINGSEYMGKFVQGNQVELYYNNSKKFETTATGVSVTGASYSTGNIGLNADNHLGFSDDSWARLVVNDTEVFRATSDGRGLSQFTAKAWARWNGTGTLAVTDSHNVSSVTDSGTGQYVVNIDVDMANTNYAAFVSSTWPNWDSDVHCGDQAVGTVNVYTVRSGGSNVYQDNPNISCVVFGD